MEREGQRRPVFRTLPEELALPDEEQIYAIDQILPLGGNALFAGKYKAGKTTFTGQLVKSWADCGEFLGRFQCHPDSDRPNVTIFNYEMSEGQFRRWLRRVGIQHQHNVSVMHLRGINYPLALAHVREEIAGLLRDTRTGLWIVDPASRAMAGLGDPSSNADAGQFLQWLDETKEAAGVRDLVLNIHMPHGANIDKGAERALGAQAWSAWADALWFLTKDEHDARWFHAYGRDVDTEKMLVHYTAEDMSVELVDTNPEIVKRNTLEKKIIEVVKNEPGCTSRVIREYCKGRNVDIAEGIDRLVKDGVISTRPGPRRAVLHYLSEDHPPLL